MTAALSHIDWTRPGGPLTHIHNVYETAIPIGASKHNDSAEAEDEAAATDNAVAAKKKAKGKPSGTANATRA